MHFNAKLSAALALCDWSGVQIKRRSIARKHCNPRPESPYKKSMAEIGDFEMREFVSSLRARSQEARARGEEFVFKPVVTGTALNLFTQYMCSTRFDAERDREFARVALLFDKIFFEINQGRAVDFFPWLMPVAGGFVSDLTDWSTEIRAFILARIADARELDLDDDERERDFTDGLLKALRREPQLSRDGILYSLEDFLGGSSALANFVSQALLLVALHPETQAKIQAEVDEATGRRRPVAMSDADDLPYATATLRETLRYVSSPIVPHVATETTVVKGHLVEKGTVVVLNNHKLNRDPALWEAPEEFRPERFVEATTVEVRKRIFTSARFSQKATRHARDRRICYRISAIFNRCGDRVGYRIYAVHLQGKFLVFASAETATTHAGSLKFKVTGKKI